jgi:hypothetical protein
MRRPKSIGLMLASAALVLAACGGASGASSPSAPAEATPMVVPTDVAGPDVANPGALAPGTDLNACEIVSAEDVSAVAGSDVDPGEFEESPTTLSPGRSECTYEGDFGRLIVSLTPEDGENLYDAARGSYDDASDIAGHGGDGAFYSKQSKRAFFWKGSVAVMLTVFLSDGEVRPFAEEIGKLALAKV